MITPRTFRTVALSLVCLALTLVVGAAHAFSGSLNFPTQASPDSLHLRAQTFSVGTQLPPYDGDLEFANEAGRLVIRKGDAFHRFDDLDVLTYEVSRDLVTVFDRSGEVFAISLPLLKGVVFEAPVPVLLGDVSTGRLEGATDDFELVSGTEAVLKELLVAGDHPLVVDPDYGGLAGDLLLIRKTRGRREIVREVARAQLFEELGAVSEMIQYITDMTLPSGQPHAGSRSATDRFRRAERNAELPWPAVQAMQLLGRDTLQRLGVDAQYWARQKARTRDRFDLKNGEEFNNREAQAAGRIAPATMLKFAAATLGGTALAAAAARYQFGPEYATVVHATFINWMGLIAPVWLDSKLRRALVRMAFTASIIPPVAWACYYAIGRKIGKTAYQTQVLLGMRAIAEINEPFWKRIAQALRQPHLIRALSLGQNPWRTVDPQSSLGREARLEAPTRMGWMSSRESNAPMSRLLNAAERSQATTHSLAHWLALVVVGEEEKLDPATLSLLMESNATAAPRARLFSREGNRRRLQLAHALMRELRSGPGRIESSTLSEATVAASLARAREVARELRERPEWRRKLDEYAYEWSHLKRRFREGLQTYAEADNRFWRTAIPSVAMGIENKNMQVPDYYGGTAFGMSIGPHADPSDPTALWADPNAITGMSYQALYSVADGQRWYSANNGAMITRIYSDDSDHNNTDYDARESRNVVPRYQGPGVWRSIGWWLNDLRNPSTGQYGEKILENLRVSTQMIQAAFLLTVLSRVAFAHAPLGESTLAFALNLIAGHLWYGVAWDIIVPTNNRMVQRIANYRRRTEDATGKIARGLRLDDPEMWNEGMREAAALFADPAARATPERMARAREVELAMAGSQSFQDAKEFMIDVLEHPPLPGKEPAWIRRTSSIVGTVIQAYLGLKMDVLTFRPDLDWGALLLKATLGAAAVYTTVALMTKGWRYYQEKKSHACENRLLYESTPGLTPGLAN